MRRFFSVSSRLPVNEVFVQQQAGGGAFLRVELGGENIVARDGTAERRAVHGLADGVGRLFRLRVITMHEIKIAVVRYALPQGMGHRLPDLVPAHLRHLEARAVVLQLAVELEAHHFAGQQAKASRVALLAGIEQHLLADAHAHQRLARRGLQQRLQHARFAQAAHAVRHGALARQDDALGRFDVGHRAGNFHVGFRRHRAQGLRHRAQIAHAVVHHHNFFHNVIQAERSRRRNGRRPGYTGIYRLPLVDGMVPAARSSSAVAMRSARPKALNTVSHWWCALLPRRLSMCSVTSAWLTKPRKNSSVRSTSKVPIIARVNGMWYSMPGRPEKSITTRDSASSSGTYEWP